MSSLSCILTVMTDSGIMKKERTEKHYVKKRLECDLSDPELNRRPKDGCGFIYMYTFRNGMRYIGQTIRSIRERTRAHAQGTLVVDEYIKSGAKFNIEILSECKKEYLNNAESYCIMKFRTMHPDGYNQMVLPYCPGNTAEFSMKMRERLSKALKDKFSDPEYRKIMMEKRKHRQEAYNKKAIICLETGKIYKMIREAVRELDCSEGLVSLSLTKGQRAKGFHFMYYSSYIEENRTEVLNVLKDWEEQKKNTRYYQNRKRISDAKRKKSRKVKCIETNKVYLNIYEAEKELGISNKRIHGVCMGSGYIKGYHFEWYDERIEV